MLSLSHHRGAERHPNKALSLHPNILYCAAKVDDKSSFGIPAVPRTIRSATGAVCGDVSAHVFPNVCISQVI